MKTEEEFDLELDRLIGHWEETDPLWDLKLAYIRCKLVPLGKRTCEEWIGIIRQAYAEASIIINGTGSTLN